MATIVGDKLKLSNYSYLLNERGEEFIESFQKTGNRTRQEKLVDAVDLDWRPFQIKNFTYTKDSSGDPYNPPIEIKPEPLAYNDLTTYIAEGKVIYCYNEVKKLYYLATEPYSENIQYYFQDKLGTFTYVTQPGDLFDSTRLLDFISYAYSMGHNLDFYAYRYHAEQDSGIKRPNIITNIGWVDKDSRIIGYTYWPAVGSIYNIEELDKIGWDGIYDNHVGEIFNDYENNVASGEYSHAEGENNSASGRSSHAEGSATIASGNYSHSEGGGTKSTGKLSHSEGYLSESSGSYSHSEGWHTLASNEGSHAEGVGNVSKITQEITNITIIDFDEKRNLIASGVASHAEGISTYADGLGSHAEGISTYSLKLGSHAEGALTYSKGFYSHAEGFRSYAINFTTHAEGYESYAIGEFTHSEGFRSHAIGDFSHIEGVDNLAYGTYTHGEGLNNVTYAAYTHIEGLNNVNYAAYTHIEGAENTIESGAYLHVENYLNTIKNSYFTHAGGSKNNIINSSYSSVEGKENTVLNSNNILSAGILTYVQDSNNLIISGDKNIAYFSNGSIINGSNNITYNDYNLIVGENNKTSNRHSLIFGKDIINNNCEFNLIFGDNTYSSGNSSTLIGKNIYSYGANNRVIGNIVRISTNSTNNSIIGKNNVLYNSENTVINGYNIVSYTYGSNITGHDIITYSTNNSILGFNISSYSYLSSIIGHDIKDSGENSFSLGRNIYNGKTDSTTKQTNLANNFSIGYNIYAYVTGQFSIGNDIANKKIDSFAIGKFITNDADGSFDIGQTINNTGNNTYIFGETVSNGGKDSFVIGKNVTNTGIGSFILGKNITNTGANSYAFGQNITDTGIDSFAIGKDINNQKNGDFGIGYDIINSGKNTYSFGQNITNKGDNSFAIGRGITTVQNTNNINFVIGSYNKLLKNGYLFALGYGTSDTDRKNAITVTNTGWTYIGALATYINNIQFYNEHIPITRDTDFVKVFSYKAINRSTYDTSAGFSDYTNAYNIYTNSYILPTKQYVDKLLELKDAFRFAGTFEPENKEVSFAQEGSTHTVEGTWNPATWYNDGETDVQTTNYDLSTAAVWRVKSSGWFGSYFVAGGDLLIAYDNVSMENDENWAIIETHMNWIDNTGAYILNDDSNYRVLTNFHLTDSGILSYSYAEIHSTYVNKQNNGFLSNVKINVNGDGDNKQIELTYVHTYFQNASTSSTQSLHNVNIYTYFPENENGNETKTNEYFKNSNDVNSITVVKNVNMNADGKLCYDYLTVNNLRMHHNNLGYFTTTYDIDAGVLDTNVDFIDLIDNVHLTQDGTLTYTRSHYINIRNHHHNKDATITTGTNKTKTYDIGEYNATGNDNFGFISNVHLESNGRLTYTTSSINNLKTHHGTTKPTAVINAYNVHISNTEGTDEFGFVSAINLDENGKLTYSIDSVTHLREHHSSTLQTAATTYDIGEYDAEGDDTASWIHSVELTNKGELKYQRRAITNLKTHHGGTTGAHDFLTSASLSPEGQLSGTGGSFSTNPTKNTTNWQINKNDTNTLAVVIGVGINSSGELSYTYRNIQDYRNHHSTGVETDDTEDNKDKDTIKVVSKIDLSSDGKLTYHVTEIGNVKHADSAGKLDHTITFKHGTSANDGTWNGSEDTIIYLNTHGGETGTHDFLTSASLSPEGQLSGTGGSFSNKGTVDTEWTINIDNERTQRVITNVSIDNTGELSFTYLDIKDKLGHHHTNDPTVNQTYDIYTNATAGDNEARFIYGVNLDVNGTLSYAYSTITNLRQHHHTNNTPTLTQTYDIYTSETAGDDEARFIYGVNLDANGTLSYAYSTVTNLRQHHHTIKAIDTKDNFKDNTGKFTTYLSVHSTNFTYNDTAAVNSQIKIDGEVKDITYTQSNEIRFIDNVHLDNFGTFSYHYTIINNLRSHHDNQSKDSLTCAYISTHKSKYTFDPDNTNNFVDTYTGDKQGTQITVEKDEILFINNVNLNKDGKLTYTAKQLSRIRAHHDTQATTTVSYASTHISDYLFKDDKLNRSDTYDGTENTSPIIVEEDNALFINNVHLDKGGKLTYTARQINRLRNHHDTAYSGPAQYYTYANRNNYTKNTINLTNDETDLITFVDGVKLDINGKLSYHFSSIGYLRQHHTYKDVTVTTGDNKTTTYDVYTDKTTGDNNFGFISNVHLESNGRLTYTTSSVTDLRQHHSNTGAQTTTTTYYNEFNRRINLSLKGELSYVYDTIWGTI